MSDNGKREILAGMGLKKAPELVSVKGQVTSEIAAAIRGIATEAGVKEDEVIGLAVTDWTKKAQRRLKAAQETSGQAEQQH